MTKQEIEAESITLETQNRIRDFIANRVGGDIQIDGSGCESGDPVDLTLSEIAQGFTVIENALEESNRLLRYAADILTPGSTLQLNIKNHLKATK